MPANVARWDPVNELSNMRSMMDRLFDGSFNRLPFRNGEDLGSAALSLDVYETNDSFVVKANVPGIDPKDLDIQVEEDVLTIRGEFEQKDEVNEENFLRRELRYGSFQRALRLPPTVDAEKAKATFEHGVLKLELPKKPEARSRTIKITPGGVLEGERQPAGEQSS